MAFLSVVTRHMPSRKNFLMLNQASLRLQTDPDYEQVMMLDEIGRGWGYANEMLLQAADLVTGKYVLALDDDDMLINAQAIERLKAVTVNGPPGVVWRAWHNDAGILPDNGHWRQAPAPGFIGTCGYVLRADVFGWGIREINQPGYKGHYASDFDLISAVWNRHGAMLVWIDILMCWAIKQSRGQ